MLPYNCRWCSCTKKMHVVMQRSTVTIESLRRIFYCKQPYFMPVGSQRCRFLISNRTSSSRAELDKHSLIVNYLESMTQTRNERPIIVAIEQPLLRIFPIHRRREQKGRRQVDGSGANVVHEERASDASCSAMCSSTHEQCAQECAIARGRIGAAASECTE